MTKAVKWRRRIGEIKITGITAIKVKESLEDLSSRLSQTKELILKERLQLLYWLKQEKAPNIGTIAEAMGRHRGTLHSLARNI